MTKLEKWIAERVTDKLNRYEGTDVYPSELAFTLFEDENCNGTYTFSRAEAQDWIKEYFNDLADVYAYIEDDWGKAINPFADAEAFQVQVMLYVAEQVLGESTTYQQLYDGDDKITLTKKIINKISSEIA